MFDSACEITNNATNETSECDSHLFASFMGTNVVSEVLLTTNVGEQLIKDVLLVQFDLVCDRASQAQLGSTAILLGLRKITYILKFLNGNFHGRK